VLLLYARGSVGLPVEPGRAASREVARRISAKGRLSSATKTRCITTLPLYAWKE
jgi:hypothetical protein